MVTAIEQYEFTKSRSFSRRSLRLGGEYQNLRHRRNPRLNIVSSCRVSESYPVGGNGVAAGTTNYIYYNNQWQAIETRTNGTADSDVTSQMVWSASYVNAAVLQDTYSGGAIQPNSRLYFEYDANWDTIAVVGYDSTTSTWDVVQRYTYSPYGTITVLNADWSTPASGTQPDVNNLYQGMTLDPVTGLYYERYRNYSLSLETWTSQDPLQYINGANTYQFVMSNPVNATDPNGTRKMDLKYIDYLQKKYNLSTEGRDLLHRNINRFGLTCKDEIEQEAENIKNLGGKFVNGGWWDDLGVEIFGALQIAEFEFRMEFGGQSAAQTTPNVGGEI